MRNLKGLQEKDIEMAMQDIDEGPLKENTRKMTQMLFDRFDLTCKVLDFKVVSADNDTAVIEVTMETRKVRGPAFNDHVGTAVHTLKKRPSGWKLAGSKIKSIKML